jgi:hypothetical protein
VSKYDFWGTTARLLVLFCTTSRFISAHVSHLVAVGRSRPNTPLCRVEAYKRKTVMPQGFPMHVFSAVLQILATFFICCIGSGVSQASVCRALVVANANYQERPLVNPKRDAAIVARALESTHCSIQLVFDDSRETVISRIAEMTRLLTTGDVFVLYYSGHGYEVNSNFHMLFSNVGMRSMNKSFETVVSLSLFTILAQASFANGFTSFFILDACRTNLPLSGNDSQLAPQQKMPIVKTPLTILYSTAPGAPAYDNKMRNSSLFAEVLSSQLKLSDTHTSSLELAVKNTAALVAHKTGFSQQPWISSTTSIITTSDDTTTIAPTIRDISKSKASDLARETIETANMTLVVMPRTKATSHAQATQACRNESARLPTAGEAQDIADLPHAKARKALAIWALGGIEQQDRCLMVGGSWHSLLPPEPKLVRHVPCVASEQVKAIVCIRTHEHTLINSYSVDLQ